MQLTFLIINSIAFEQFHCEPEVQSISHAGKTLEGFSKDFHSFSLCFYLLCSRAVTVSFFSPPVPLHIYHNCMLAGEDYGQQILPFDIYPPHNCGQRHLNSGFSGLLTRWAGTCYSAHPTWPPEPLFQGHQPGGQTQGQNMFCNLSPNDLVSLGTYFWVDCVVDNENTHT